jgi:hypothetical protein
MLCSKEWKKCPFYKEKSLVGLTPGVSLQHTNKIRIEKGSLTSPQQSYEI